MALPADAARRQALAQTTLELVEIPSVTGQEGPLCDWVQRWFADQVPWASVTRINDSLVVQLGDLRPERPTVCLLGHLDTVPPRESGPPRLDAQNVYGCGVSDMKAGLAVKMRLAQWLGEAQAAALGANVLLVFYEREEGAYDDNGLQPLLEQDARLRQVDLGFCLEPSDNRLQLGSLGGIHCTLTVQGRSAHSARPWQGDNALHAAWPLIKAVADRGRRAVEAGGVTFYEVMSLTQASSGRARNVVPDRATFNLNYRIAPGTSLETAQAQIEAMVAGSGVPTQIDWTDLSPSGAVCRDNPLMAPLNAWAAADQLVIEPKQAWTDVARLAIFGIDAVNFGPGESAQAHQANERCSIDLIAGGFDYFWRYLQAL